MVWLTRTICYRVNIKPYHDKDDLLNPDRIVVAHYEQLSEYLVLLFGPHQKLRTSPILKKILWFLSTGSSLTCACFESISLANGILSFILKKAEGKRCIEGNDFGPNGIECRRTRRNGLDLVERKFAIIANRILLTRIYKWLNTSMGFYRIIF